NPNCSSGVKERPNGVMDRSGIFGTRKLRAPTLSRATISLVRLVTACAAVAGVGDKRKSFGPPHTTNSVVEGSNACRAVMKLVTCVCIPVLLRADVRGG